jgi:2-phosphosulfolactate phosphatase
LKLLVSLLPPLRSVSPSTDIAVVIDVLRATSVMATALAHGAKQIVTCEQVDESEMVAEMISDKPLLCGERGCRPIPGFDLGNSPSEYRSAVVQDRVLVLTTTNGTHAIAAAGPADRIITASFLNLAAVVDAISAENEVHLVCAGTEGTITAEDTLLAGAIVHALEQESADLELIGDEPFLAAQLWRASFGGKLDVDPASLAEQLAHSQGGRNLIAANYRNDLLLCAQLNSAAVVPERISTAPSTFGLTAKTN